MATLIATELRDTAAARRGGTCWRDASPRDVVAAGLTSVSQKTPVSGGDLRQIRGILSVISARTGRDGGA